MAIGAVYSNRFADLTAGFQNRVFDILGFLAMGHCSSKLRLSVSICAES